MINIKHYMEDGANYQAQAVLAFLKGTLCFESNEANPKVSRWENCREQGYVVMLKSEDYGRQLNIAFFEHRNSDEIHAIKWEELAINSPTIETANMGGLYETKYDTSYSVGYGEVVKMAEWIGDEFKSFREDSSYDVK
jgi:hypothetical protein